MEAAVRGQRGLVLQFIGDEIEAVFGAPLRAPDHADRAVAAALGMRRRTVGPNVRRGNARIERWLRRWTGVGDWRISTRAARRTARPRCATASESTAAPCWPAT